MLLVIRTEAAVERAAVLGAGEGRQRTIPRLQPIAGGLPVGDIVADQGLLHAMFGAALQVVDAALLTDHLGRDQPQAGLAQARGLTEEQVRRAPASRRVLQNGPCRRRPIHRRPGPEQ